MTTIRSQHLDPTRTDEETIKISEKVNSKVKELMTQQYDKSHLTTQALPPVPKDYKSPTITNGFEGMRNQSFVVTNDSHIRSTNPGYSRNEKGGFFCH